MSSILLSASLIATPILNIFDTYKNIVSANEFSEKVSKKVILDLLNDTENNVIGIEYKENLKIELPSGYNQKQVTNPITKKNIY